MKGFDETEKWSASSRMYLRDWAMSTEVKLR